MNRFLTPPTSPVLRCVRNESGLLGSGYQAFTGESATNFYMKPQNIAGHYAVDDYTAALYLVYQLSSRDEQLTPLEAERSALTLYEVLQRIKTAKNISIEALQSLQAAAEDIPEIGPLMFSAGNLPGTVATVSGALMAVSQTKKVIDLLDLTAEQKTKFRNWANNRGTPSARSASKVFKGTVRIISKEGHLFFEVPVTAAAKHHKILGEVGQAVAHIPLGNPKAALNQRAPLNALGARGKLGFLTSNPIGILLAVGPQGYLDWSSSVTTAEFKRKSFYSQPTNIASFVAGWGTALLIGFAFGTGAPLVLVIIASAGVGLLVQKAMSYYKIDQKIGDYYTK
ncbi:hypothetical protein N027_25535 [Pseudomonas syringae USA007]|uniref:Uncharacterized protein n=1 Tax=Pseudomonas syringae USA007 TaxID=1357288 RepID=A0AAU8M864_PSESX